MNRLFWLAPLAIALGLCLLLWALTERAPAAPTGPRAAQSETQDPAAADPIVTTTVVDRARPQPDGRARRYAITFHNEFLPDDAAPAAVGLLLGFSGSLVITPVDAEGSWSHLRLSEVTPLVDSDERNWLSEREERYWHEAFGQPFYVSYAADGRLSALKLRPGLDPLTEGIFRVIAAATQFAPLEASEPTWRVTERDSVGEAVVEYRRLAPERYEKRKLTYSKLLTETGLAAPAAAGISVEVRGLTTLEHEEGGASLTSLLLREDSTTQLGDTQLNNHLELGLRFLGTSTDAQALAEWKRDVSLPSIALDRLPALPPVDREAQLRERLGEKTLPELLADVRRLRPDDARARSQVLEQLEALLQLQPGAAGELNRVVRDGRDEDASLFISALGNAGTEQAERALREVADDPSLEPRRREAAVALLGMDESPSADTLDYLRDVSADPRKPHRRTATLAYGNLAVSAGGANAQGIVETLLARLRAATNEAEQVLCLSALGNTGDRQLPELLEPWLGGAATAVRAEAGWALRLVGTPEALTRLTRLATSDAEASVRGRAVEALRYRPLPETSSVLAAVLQRDPEASVRLAALGVVSTMGAPNARDLLDAVAEDDPDADVRAEATRLLSAG